MKFKTAVIFLILLGSAVHFTNAAESSIWNDIGNTLKNAVSGGCATLVGGVSSGTCYTQYRESVSILESINEDSPEAVKYQGSFKYCCAVSAFRTCILNQIQEACGEQAESQSRQIVTKVVTGASGQSQDEQVCTGEEIVFNSASPLCWPPAAQYSLILFLIGFFGVCCCCCIMKKLCR